jgi:hypothetical protein
MDQEATKRAKKWDKAEHTKLRKLFEKGQTDPECNNGAYQEKICKKHWRDQKIEMFRKNWKSSTAKNFIAKFKDGTRARSAAKDNGKDEDENKDKGKEGESCYCFVLACSLSSSSSLSNFLHENTSCHTPL